MDKDIQEIRRRAGIDEAEHLSYQDEKDLYTGYQEGHPNVLTDKDKRTVASRIITLLKRHREWRHLTSALTEMVMSEMERLYDMGYRDGQMDPIKTESLDEAMGKWSPEDVARLRRVWKIPESVKDKDIMKFINQAKYKRK